MKKMGLLRGVVLAGLLLAVVAGIGYSAPGGSQSVSIAAASRIDVTVPATADSVINADPTTCGTTTSTINVRSNRQWNLQIRSEPVGYPNGKAKNGATEMVNVFQFRGGDVLVFTDIAAAYGDLFLANQGATGNRNVAMTYQQCVDWLDAPGNYTIVVEYLGLQF